MRGVLIVLFAVFCFLGVKGQNWVEDQKIVASDRSKNASYGNSVSLSGNYVLVGAVLDDNITFYGSNAFDIGAAYMYKLDSNGVWNEIQKIVASDRVGDQHFGTSVAVSGGYAIIGADRDDRAAGSGNGILEAGTAYIYELDSFGNWNEVQKIDASDRGYKDRFGRRVAIEGEYAFIGADANNGNTTTTGAVYVFKRDSTGYWYEFQKLVHSDNSYLDQFSSDISVSSGRLIVGAPLEDENQFGSDSMHNAGSAYIFEQDSLGYWYEVQKIVSPERKPEKFIGGVVAISNDFAVLGSTAEEHNIYGNDSILNAGAAYIYKRDSLGSWHFLQKIVANQRGVHFRFGSQVSIDDDHIVVGSDGYSIPDSLSGSIQIGAAYVFKRSQNGFWYQTEKLINYRGYPYNSQFGNDVSLDGDFVVIGDINGSYGTNGYSYNEWKNNAGAAYIFKSCYHTDSNVVVSACNYFNAPSGNNVWTTSGIYFDTIQNNSECDSLLVFDVNIYPSTYDTIDTIVCYNYEAPSGHFLWDSSGIYNDTIVNFFGCDSVITINLKVNNADTVVNIFDCYKYTSPSGNYFWTTTGTYFDTISNSIGCDSIITVNLLIGRTDSIINISVCDSYTSPSGNYTWTASGSYFDTILNSIGCDSSLVVMLDISNTNYDTLEVTACDFYVSPSGNHLWSRSGVFLDTLINVLGCDSILSVNLTINYSLIHTTISTINVTSCNYYITPSRRDTFYSNGTYIDTIPNRFNCDSIITINLTIIRLNTINSIVNDRYLTCGQTCLTLNSNTPSNNTYIYGWSTSETTKNIQVCPNATTAYYLTVTDTSGCTVSDTATVFVSDTLCGAGKVTVCHTLRNRQYNFCVDTGRLAYYLSQGATLGCCTNAPPLLPGPSGLGGIFSQVYPNPFTYKTTIEFGSEQDEFVTVEVFNMTGQRVANLFTGEIESLKVYTADFNRGDLPTGIYISKISSASGKVIYQKLFVSN